MTINQRQDEFQQRIIAATIPHDPQLNIARTLFPEHGIVEDTQGDRIFYPSNAEEFDEMAKLFPA